MEKLNKSTARTELSEAKIQSACVTWLWNERSETRGLFFSITNNSEHIARAMQRKALGLVAGVSDTIFFWRGKMFCIEFKTPTGKQSARQIWWQNQIVKQGGVYIIVRSLDEFKAVINDILT